LDALVADRHQVEKSRRYRKAREADEDNGDYRAPQERHVTLEIRK
jgi:hypothetical protein